MFPKTNIFHSKNLDPHLEISLQKCDVPIKTQKFEFYESDTKQI